MKAREASQSSHADNKKGVRTLVPIPIGCVLGMITEDVEIGQNLTDAKLVEPKLKVTFFSFLLKTLRKYYKALCTQILHCV